MHKWTQYITTAYTHCAPASAVMALHTASRLDAAILLHVRVTGSDNLSTWPVRCMQHAADRSDDRERGGGGRAHVGPYINGPVDQQNELEGRIKWIERTQCTLYLAK